MNRELLLLVDALAREKNVPKEIVFVALESALASATKKALPQGGDRRARVDRPGNRRLRNGVPALDGRARRGARRAGAPARDHDAAAKDPELKIGDVIEEPLSRLSSAASARRRRTGQPAKDPRRRARTDPERLPRARGQSCPPERQAHRARQHHRRAAASRPSRATSSSRRKRRGRATACALDATNIDRTAKDQPSCHASRRTGAPPAPSPGPRKGSSRSRPPHATRHPRQDRGEVVTRLDPQGTRHRHARGRARRR